MEKNLTFFFFFYCFSIFIFFTNIHLLLAADTITPGGFIQDGDKLVSSAQRFELGFFSPGQSKSRYLGVWYKQSPEKVVWVANRNNPIPDSNGSLAISDDGNLLLLNGLKGVIWSSNISRKLENPVAQLLDNGNFIVKDNFSSNVSESYLWQSFDSPTDILLPEMKLGRNLKAGFDMYLTAWRSADDPSYGDFTLKLDIHLLSEMVIYNRSVKFARTGPWNGAFYGGIPTKPNLLFVPIVVNNQDEYTYRYESFNNPIVMLLKLNNSGMIQWQVWNERTTGWDVVYIAPEDLCGHYRHCGANSVCDIDKTQICECLKGFAPNSQSNQTSFNGCVRHSQLDCKGGDEFIKLDGIKLADLIDVSLNESMSLAECEAKCLNNCSCQAYINSNVTGGGSGCLMWFGDLIDIRKLVENRGTQDIFIRVPASELGTNSSVQSSTDNKNKGNGKPIWTIFIPILTLAMVILGFIVTYVRRSIRSKGEDLLQFDVSMGLDDDHAELTEVKKPGESRSRKEVKLPLFSFASVSAATENFSSTNMLGEGGFGPVYKGTLLKGDQIAVKRLSKRSGQGWEELKNEAILIAKLQHKNLVRLLGCCIEQDEKILIYEYMSNKSLDIFLFDPEKRKLLDWTIRVRIIEGIAQGLLYLHEYSRLRIIHRDLKASNILLDKDMNPKISDFGMARIFGGDELQANTQRIVGTYGYMPPEYALEGVFSIKSDVFSFGVLLLEIISGKKNTGFYQAESVNLLGYAWDKWTNDRALDMMDPVLEDAASEHILPRYVNIGLLCVQENAEDRPSMCDVVSMLMNETATLSSPKQPAFAHVRSQGGSRSSVTRPENCSVNDITVTIMEPR
ncbi:receptor-like serine/threonine-protein kinase SD1-8 [Mangifera indica]|uniref:receptor-like serine/threonine-protein kinase SD1-8 n=1 Tax=Mangifera indica TaxID=29780 RepID=UPI001CFB6078|nr:receptor-like serine/threonine-protein kinase SD1-8 [Mangifera indica]